MCPVQAAMRNIILFVGIFINLCVFAQLTDDFSDGDFTANPAWVGTSADFTVNGSFELQLNNSVAAVSYLSTPHGLVDLNNKEWKLWTRQSFAPSGGNNGRVYLTSSASDLSTDPDGFYLQLGEAGSTDAVRLFKCVSGVHTEILAGPVGQIASSFAIGIRVVRDATANWSLYIDDTGGTSYVLAGTVNDATALLGMHFGFLDTYTVSNATGFYYDDIYVGNEILDTTPPVLASAVAISATQVDVQFDEALDQPSAENITNYSIAGLTVSNAVLDGVDPSLVHLTVSAMTNGQTYTLTTNNIADLSANVSGNQNTDYSYTIPENPLPGDVIINEFFCDPTPQVGLANAEFVEIYNRSSKVFDVSGWQLADASSTGTCQTGILLPGDYIVLSSTSNIDSFAVATGVTSFPSLNNSGDNIVLRDMNGVILDSITYTDEWYKDPNKDGGGYTIERINSNDPCSDADNWAASNDNLGGTPDEINSIDDPTPDTDIPGISQLIALAPNYLEIYFDEGMDSTSLADAVYSVAPILTVLNVYVLEAYPNKVILEFVETIQGSQVYSLNISSAADCWLNSASLNGIFALAEPAAQGDVIINEILFNPTTGGSDWVELYNNSDKLIDLFNWEVANFDNDTIDNNKLIEEHFLLYPGDYMILSEDSLQVGLEYPAYVPGKVVQMDLPTFSNDSSTVYIIQGGSVMDKVSYSDDWHFKLLDDEDGKSLERIDPDGLSDDSNNWHTAAEQIGFATPADKNSQYYPAIQNGEFSFTSNTVSPDNDGYEDVLQVNYEMIEHGLIADFTIYDDRGREVAKVLDSELLGIQGTFIWDGVRNDNTKASIGVYVAVFEAWSLDGGVIFTQRKAFTVAGTL